MPFPGSDFSLFPIEELPFLPGEDLIDVALPDISPARLFMDGLYKIFERDEALFIRDKSELIRMVAENIDQETGKGLDFDLCFSLAQDAPPSPEAEKDYMIQSFTPITTFLSNKS